LKKTFCLVDVVQCGVFSLERRMWNFRVKL
jgi:hypothetical protein